MTQFSELLAGQTVLPIIQANSVTEGVNIASSMKAAGLNLVEVVLRTEESLAALKAIKAQFPDMIVGAGTVTNETVLADAVSAGADFIVTPAVSDKLLSALSQCQVPVLPGVANTADILLATEYGFTEMKLFPASLAGGIPFLTAVSSVFSQVRFCPTGGVSQANVADFLALNNVFAAGGTWMAQKEWVTKENWSAITEASKLANGLSTSINVTATAVA